MGAANPAAPILLLFPLYHFAEVGRQQPYRIPAEALDGVCQEDIHFGDPGYGKEYEGKKRQEFGQVFNLVESRCYFLLAGQALAFVEA